MKLSRIIRGACAFACTAVSTVLAQTYTFSSPGTYSTFGGLATDSAGTVYATNYYGHQVSKLSADGRETPIAGSLFTSGSANGTGTAARFNTPIGVAVDNHGNLFVADSGNHCVRKITPAGEVTTLAGDPSQIGSADGTGSAARFFSPQGIAVDTQGTVYVTDTGNSNVRRITSDGVVTTLAGSALLRGAVNGTGQGARFDVPQGIVVDASGNLFVADSNNHAIRKVTPTGVVTTFAGSLGNSGSADGAGANARFNNPTALAITSTGTLYVSDAGNFTIRRIASDGTVQTLGGLAGASGNTSGTGSTARFYGARALAVDGSGTLYIGESYGFRLGVPSSQVAVTVGPLPMTVAAGSSAAFSVTATGDDPIAYQWQKDGTAISGATKSVLAFTAVDVGSSGSYSVRVSNALGNAMSPAAQLTVVAALPNDNFANAQVLSGASGTINGHNNGATGEPGEPTHNVAAATASSVWYQWTSPQNGTFVLDIPGNYAGFATAIYTGDTLTTLTRLAQTTGSRVSVAATSGTTYRIAIGGAYATSRGSFTLQWRMLLNNDFANAETITGNSGQVNGANDVASSEAGEPEHLAGTSARNTSIWYRWTPAQTGTVTLTTTSNFSTVIALYSGSSLSSLTSVGAAQSSSNAGSTGRVDGVVANVTAGTTYSIAVGSYGYGTGNIALKWTLSTAPVITTQPLGGTVVTGGSRSLTVGYASAFDATFQWSRDGKPLAGATGATYQITNAQTTDAGQYSVTVTNANGSVTSANAAITVLVPPTNDNFADAQALAGLSGTTTSNNTNATSEPGEPIHWSGFGTASSVWFKWAPASSGLAVIDTVGSNFDTVLAVYTGKSLTTLTRLVQDDDRGGGRTSQVSFAANANTTYYIAVGGNTGARGAITLNWQLSPTLAIATQPVSQTIAVGGSATFAVQATGTGVTYQWMRNGVAIPGATNSSLTIGNVQGGTDASYTVVITNSSGSVTSAPATLAVAAPMLATLTMRNQRQEGGWLWSIAGGNGTLVAVGMGGNILTSTDAGKTWVPRSSGTSLWLVAVTYGAGQFVIVGESATILTSGDGVTWTQAPAPGTTERINNVVFADGKFVAVGEKGTILTSLDARTWTPRNSGIKTWLHGLAYNAKIGYFATDGENGVILTSPDAITWTNLPVDGLTSHLEAVVASDSYAEFVAVGHEGACVSIHQNQLRLKTGETLTTWSTELNPIGTKESFVGMATGAGALFAVGDSGKIVSAKDSRGPWYTIPSGTNEILLGATYYNDTLYAVGMRETILQSDPLYRSRLVNISTRGQVGTDSNILISGFVVTGSTPKQVLVRAAGPALGAAPFNLSGVLAQPVLTVVDERNTVLGTNSGWSSGTTADAVATAIAQVGAFPFARGSADAALLLTLKPGSYSAKVSGVGNTTGVAIVEVYDADPLSNTASRAINISTRGVTGNGSDVMIAGFVVNGAASRRVLIRAAGPALTAFGVGGAASEPQLELYNGKGLLTGTAGAWGLQSNADEIRTAAKAVGAFDLAEGSKDSAMLVTLLPGAWTVQITTANKTPGVALIEVYEVP